ncbi:MAG: hypothetical protein WCI20_07300 [bacterium]
MLCPDEIVPPAKVTAVMLEVQAFLQSSPKTGYAPFRIPILSHWLSGRSAVDKIVANAGALLPELGRWLDTQAKTANVWVVKFPRPKKV